MFSSPDLEAGASYDIYVGGSDTDDDFGGVYDAGAHTGGSLSGTLTAG